MKPCNGFIISIFLALLSTPFSSLAQSADCRKMNITVEVSHSQNGGQGSIKVSNSDKQLSLTLHLIGIGESKNDQTKITTGTVKDIPPGTYDLVIQAPTGYCSETRKVTVN
jgi:hypothetical protein